MENKIEIKEIKVRVAVRMKPGDRWKCIFKGANETIIFDSLTDTLEYIYQTLGNTQFFMDARAGVAYVVDTEEIVFEPTPEKKWSLYGE
jgi:hypothetical protein